MKRMSAEPRVGDYVVVVDGLSRARQVHLKRIHGSTLVGRILGSDVQQERFGMWYVGPRSQVVAIRPMEEPNATV